MNSLSELYESGRHEADGIVKGAEAPVSSELSAEIRALCEKLGPKFFARPHVNPEPLVRKTTYKPE